MSKEAVHAGAVEIGVQLAAIENTISRIMTAVMTSAVHHKLAAAEPLLTDVDRLDDMVTSLAVEVRRYRKAFRA